MSFILDPYRFAVAGNKNLAVVTWVGDGTNGRQIAGPDMSGGGVVIFFSFAGSQSARGFCFSTDGSTVYFGPGSLVGVRTGLGMNANGITVSNLGGEPAFNQSGQTYLAVVASKDPDICNVIPYVGNATNRTIAHGLTARPDFVTAINIDTTNQNVVQHNYNDNTMQHWWNFGINATLASLWNSTSPDGTNVTIGSATGVSALNTNGEDYFLICINQNVCRQLTYTGNGSATGPSVTGFGYTPDLIYTRVSRLGDNQSARIVSDKLTAGYVGNEQEFDFANSIITTAERVGAVTNGYQVLTSDLNWNRSGRTFLTYGFRPKP